ncbi:MAG: hypothetical protein IIZ68_10365 [Clostridia bacterium]|nr:hypothetical protein [Clostridia bacterium]
MNQRETTARDARIDALTRKLGMEPGTAGDQIRHAAAQNPAVASALRNLSDGDIEKISAVLSDRDAARKLLSTPQAQALLKMLRS